MLKPCDLVKQQPRSFQPEFHFRNANRRALYFSDPAENVLELIARDDVGDTAKGSFKLADIRSVNHVGITVDDVLLRADEVSESLGIELFGRAHPQFTRVGNAYRHLVFVPRDRLWIPENRLKSAVYPVDVTMSGKQDAESTNQELKFNISMTKGE